MVSEFYVDYARRGRIMKQTQNSQIISVINVNLTSMNSNCKKDYY